MNPLLEKCEIPEMLLWELFKPQVLSILGRRMDDKKAYWNWHYRTDDAQAVLKEVLDAPVSHPMDAIVERLATIPALREQVAVLQSQVDNHDVTVEQNKICTRTEREAKEKAEERLSAKDALLRQMASCKIPAPSEAGADAVYFRESLLEMRHAAELALAK